MIDFGNENSDNIFKTFDNEFDIVRKSQLKAINEIDESTYESNTTAA